MQVRSLPAVASLLALLPDDAQLTITVGKADLLRALDEGSGANPEHIDTKRAAARLGYSADRWRRWAEQGRITGAWQDARGGSWRLPFASCEAHIRELQKRGQAALIRGTRSASSSRSLPRGSRSARNQRIAREARRAIPIEAPLAACA